MIKNVHKFHYTSSVARSLLITGQNLNTNIIVGPELYYVSEMTDTSILSNLLATIYPK